MKKIFLTLILLLIASGTFAQLEMSLQLVDNTGAFINGYTDTQIKFRRSPYGAGDVISGLTVTQPGGNATGNYLVYGFPSYEPVRLYISGTLQEWYGTKLAGDDRTYFGCISCNNTWTGLNTFQDNTTFSDAVSITATATIEAPKINTGSAEYIAGTPEDNNSLVWKKWVVDNFIQSVGGGYFPVNANRIIVDSKQTTDVSGKIYNTISEAVSYAYLSGSPTSNNRWLIVILPGHNGIYTDNWVWYDYIDMIGMGYVSIKNTFNEPPYSIFTRSGGMTDRNVKCVNLNFEQTDANITFQKMIVINCSVRTIEDNYAPNISLNGSQFENCVFTHTGSGSFTTVNANNIVNSVSNTLITFGSSDIVAGWVVNTSLTYQQ
ncbi:MAG: hypothetical protein IT280_13040 [Ignavibacteria bacterium]|nr:hypothetical protein [Ignavibacteria bacterium]